MEALGARDILAAVPVVIRLPAVLPTFWSAMIAAWPAALVIVRICPSRPPARPVSVWVEAPVKRTSEMLVTV